MEEEDNRRLPQANSVTVACGTTFFAWIVFYVVIVANVFVVWKWDTPKQISLETPIRELEDAIARSRNRNSHREEQLSTLGQLDRRMSADITRLQQEQVIPTVPPIEEPSILRLQQLLKIQDIVEYRSASKAISMAIMELKNYLPDDSTTIDHRLASLPRLFQALQDALTMEFEPISLCTDSGLSPQQVTAATPSFVSLATTQDSTLPMIRSKQDMESLTEALRQAIAQAKAAAATANAQHENCLTSLEHPSDWLEAGLEAWNDQRDVREAILEAIQQQDDDGDVGVTDIILDANLDLTGRHGWMESRSPQKVNVRDLPLRHVLDTPLLHAITAHIDAILELVSGHNDFIDDLLDRHVYSLLQSDEDSIARVAVDRLLTACGGLTINRMVERLQGKS